MFTFLSIVYVIVCAFLILVVLLQSGKGGGMGALGGGAAGSTTVFGGAGAGNFLTRLTAINAALFMILSASLAYLSTSGEQSLDRAVQQTTDRDQAAEQAATEGVAPEPEAAGMSTDDEPGDVEEPADDLEGAVPNLVPPVEGPEQAADENAEAAEPAGAVPPDTTMAPVRPAPPAEPDEDPAAAE